MGWLRERGGESKLMERIETLEKAHEALESKVRLLKVEWESVLDKVNSVMGRLNARIRKSEATTAPESEPEVHPQGVDPARILGSHGTLSEMRRRRGVLSG